MKPNVPHDPMMDDESIEELWAKMHPRPRVDPGVWWWGWACGGLCALLLAIVLWRLFK